MYLTPDDTLFSNLIFGLSPADTVLDLGNYRAFFKARPQAALEGRTFAAGDLRLQSLTDENWSGGVSNTEQKLLLPRTAEKEAALQVGTRLQCGEAVARISAVQADESGQNLILTVEGDKGAFFSRRSSISYPNGCNLEEKGGHATIGLSRYCRPLPQAASGPAGGLPKNLRGAL